MATVGRKNLKEQAAGPVPVEADDIKETVETEEVDETIETEKVEEPVETDESHVIIAGKPGTKKRFWGFGKKN